MSRRRVLARETWRYGPVTAVRYGRVVTVHLPAGSTIPGAQIGQASTPATLPEGWRPVAPASTAAIGPDGSFRAHAYVMPNGNVNLAIGRAGGSATDGGVTLETSLSVTFVY